MKGMSGYRYTPMTKNGPPTGAELLRRAGARVPRGEPEPKRMVEGSDAKGEPPTGAELLQRAGARARAATSKKKMAMGGSCGTKKMMSGGMTKGYATGGVTRADGCVTKGYTKGRMV